LEPTFNFFTNKLATEARVEITQNSWDFTWLS
jgi:hypothetical protein